MTTENCDSLILLFAKAPVAGQVKTRLLPGLSAKRAATLYQRMLEHTVTELCQGAGQVAVYTSGDATHPCWGSLASLGARYFYPQCGADLGERMSAAVRERLAAGAASVILVGGDCPAMDSEYIAAAEAALRGTVDVVIGPARDGGYVLLGLRQYYPQLFVDIPWSSDQVLTATLAVCERLNLTIHRLPTLPDIDRPEDLALLPADWLE